MNQYRDLVAKLEAIQNRVDEAIPLDQLRQAAGVKTTPNPLANAPKPVQMPTGPVDLNQFKPSQKEVGHHHDSNDQLLVGEENVEECGLPGMSNMPSGMMGTPKQQDNVTMNISMNGTGAGGIRDLMGILKNIENGGHEPEQHAHDHDEIVVGMGEEQATGGFDFATTEPQPETQPTSAVLKKGPDLHGNMGDHRPRQAGLPRAQMENLVSHLSTLYQEVKGR